MDAFLDPRETHYRITGPQNELTLFLRKLPAAINREHQGAVLYIHGATFPSGLSVAFRMDGRSWRDALCDAGFDVWALDFYGFGGSDRYAEMGLPANASAPLCGADAASEQVGAAVRFILSTDAIRKVSLVAHSWGSMPACLFAIDNPDLIHRIVLFAPIARRDPETNPPSDEPATPGWRLVNLDDQHRRFIADVPAGCAGVLLESEFHNWGEAYISSDPESASRTPASVKIPTGPTFEIAEAWRGRLPYQPRLLKRPVAIIRGEWDSLVTDADARWLFDAFTHSPDKRDVKISCATHLMHLENGRDALYAETNSFLVATTERPL